MCVSESGEQEREKTQETVRVCEGVSERGRSGGRRTLQIGTRAKMPMSVRIVERAREKERTKRGRNRESEKKEVTERIWR